MNIASELRQELRTNRVLQAWVACTIMVAGLLVAGWLIAVLIDFVIA